MNDRFEISAKEKQFSIVAIVVGLLLAAAGFFLNAGEPAHVWTSLMYNSAFFVFIALTALFFIAANTVGYSGWYIVVKRVFEAMSTYLPIGGIILLVAVALGGSHIYHWMDPHAVEHDVLLQRKEAFLNVPFFWTRIVAYVAIWSLFMWLLRKNSLASDANPSLNVYNKSLTYSGLFLFFFAITSSTASWDFLMSVQPHWYSTLWGWYCFISGFVTALAFCILLVMYLQSRGYLGHVSQEHVHDLGKFMFAFSVAWAYLFFSQYMLIWYANIPEETMYFKIRIDHYGPMMYLMILLNFFAPFIVLMTRGAKRNRPVLAFGAIMVIIGHWLDFFQMSVPGAVAAAAHGHEIHWVKPGLLEVGLFLFFIGLFTFVFFNSMSKAATVPVNHPFKKESYIHHT